MFLTFFKSQNITSFLVLFSRDFLAQLTLEYQTWLSSRGNSVPTRLLSPSDSPQHLRDIMFQDASKSFPYLAFRKTLAGKMAHLPSNIEGQFPYQNPLLQSPSASLPLRCSPVRNITISYSISLPLPEALSPNVQDMNLRFPQCSPYPAIWHLALDSENDTDGNIFSLNFLSNFLEHFTFSL